MVNEEIVGIDVDHNWILGKEGDLQLVKGSDNLSQAIYLRLTAFLGSMDWCYNEYGSEVKSWLGKNQNIYTRNTLLSEINKRISLDERIKECMAELIDWSNNTIGIKIDATIKDGTTFQDYYIFSDLPRKDENINSPQWKNTWISTNDDGYFAKVGEFVTVTCTVLYTAVNTKDKIVNKIVPIGEVSVFIGSYHIDIENNPQEVAQSGTDKPGSCTFTFRVPPFVKVGKHELIFKYKGIKGYNNCEGRTVLNVVKKMPTSMEYIYPTEVPWYFANPVDNITETIVKVVDANDYIVKHGEVRYYLSNKDDSDVLIYIDYPLIFHETPFHGSVLMKNAVKMYCSASLLDYSTKFIFNINYMFRPHDIIELVSANGDHIDYLECLYDGKGNKAENIVFYLVSTQYTYPYEYLDEDGFREDHDRNDDIDVQRQRNSHLIMKVIE